MTALIGITLVGCTQSNKVSKTQDAETVASKVPDTKSTACFEQYKTNFDKMLTKDEILAQYPVDFDKAELTSSASKKYSPYNENIYYWDGDPNRAERLVVMGKDMGSKSYGIGVRYLDFYDEDEEFPVKRFTATHSLTEEDKAKAREALDKEADKEGSATSKKTKKKVANSIISGIKFTPVDGVGDAAVWDHQSGSLVVLKGRATFEVLVDVSDDHDKNLDLAKKFAKTILAKCA